MEHGNAQTAIAVSNRPKRDRAAGRRFCKFTQRPRFPDNPL
jgi:hypothetical protein